MACGKGLVHSLQPFESHELQVDFGQCNSVLRFSREPSIDLSHLCKCTVLSSSNLAQPRQEGAGSPVERHTELR